MIIIIIIANADIYFDKTLMRLGYLPNLNLKKTVLALLEWQDKDDQLLLLFI